MVFRELLRIQTRGRGFESLTERVANVVSTARIDNGLCNVFVRHTSASLLISENADPAVGRDLESFMQRIAPDGSPDYEHDAEGPDDMPAHIRSVLTNTTLSVPIADGRLMLGTWQGIYLWEHRHRGHSREVIVTVVGER
ncbi:secondary thiamine-phosphate synthase enzyme [Povalibacter uvarum]|uniref:Secondary thiamine-phosphate synthase enzyme n=1 Tax=Povalibacter uvarum TaxID=732238 RepID=A0A841HIQ0_9GAMM|nr:secondary thiamine-phosphate synthase enzyme YjbQ [Povalibacter uvarum]MBB6092269.1 secondary thiamine-phosphate synthase enzyme [Povalibacter uvarum]